MLKSSTLSAKTDYMHTLGENRLHAYIVTCIHFWNYIQTLQSCLPAENTSKTKLTTPLGGICCTCIHAYIAPATGVRTYMPTLLWYVYIARPGNEPKVASEGSFGVFLGPDLEMSQK
jgi:hypothetical protein